MIPRTAGDVDRFCRALWRGDDDEFSHHFTAEWSPDRSGGLLRVWQMYHTLPLTHAHLMALARFFGTMNVGKFEDIDDPGCDTCDHGSRRGFELRVEPGETPPPAATNDLLLARTIGEC